MIEIFHKQMDSTSATKSAYDRLYTERGILQRDSFYLWLLKILNPHIEGLLLDISTGEGRLVTLAHKNGQRTIGIDFSFQALEIAIKDTRSACFAVGDGENLPLHDSSVDYITHIGSLEHYFHTEQGACEIGRVLKPGGKAVILLPNAFGLFGNIKHVWLHGEVFDDGQPIQRYATRDMWKSILEFGGLKVDKIIPYSEIDFPRTVADLKWIILRPQKILRGLISLFVPLNLANHLVFVCSKSEYGKQSLKQSWTYRS